MCPSSISVLFVATRFSWFSGKVYDTHAYTHQYYHLSRVDKEEKRSKTKTKKNREVSIVCIGGTSIIAEKAQFRRFSDDFVWQLKASDVGVFAVKSTTSFWCNVKKTEGFLLIVEENVVE